MNSALFTIQDTTLRVAADTLLNTSAVTDSSGGIKKFSVREANELFRTMERREKRQDSLRQVHARNAYLRSLELKKQKGFDTSAVPYNFSGNPSPAIRNPLNPLREKYFSAKDTAQPVFISQESAGTFTGRAFLDHPPVKAASSAGNLRPDWLLAIIIGSLVLLAWLKLFYNKFFDQTIQSIGNFQLSTKLLRDQNLFSRRVAFTLNVNFIFVGAAYIYLLSVIYHIRPLTLNGFPSFLVYAGILAGLLILRWITSRTIGHLFRMQHEFREYQHELLLIYKNLGIYLLAFVIGIAYIREEFRIYLVILSAGLWISAFLLRIIKSLKIVLNNKDILIFYLILYLCTLEILPILIFYRFFSSSILTGQV